MPLILADRVRDTTTTTGTGTVTLSGTAPTGYQNFSVIGNGNTTYYTINAGSQWEVGIGTYSSTGPTLSRDTVLESSNANALVNFAAGVKDVFVTYPSDKSVIQDANGNVGIGINPVNLASGRGVQINAPAGQDTRLKLTNVDSGTGTFDGFDLGVAVNGAVNLIGWEAAPMSFFTSGTERMRVTNGGDVCIATTTPVERFTVQGGMATSVGSGGFFQTTYTTANAGSRSWRLRNDVNVFGDFAIQQSTTQTGSTYADRMAFDASGNVGIGVSPAANTRLYVRTAAITDTAYYADNGANSGYTVRFASALTSIGNDFGAPLALLTNNTERVRITATGDVGIGTSSPTAKLDVNNGANTEMRLSTSGSGYLQVGQFTNGAFIGTSSTDATAGVLRLGTGGTERMRLDTAGNLGLGVTLNAWTEPAFQLRNGAMIATAGPYAHYMANAYYQGGWKYTTTERATRYEQFLGQHAWFVAPSGTAGNAITFTQAMTLSASAELILDNGAGGGRLTFVPGNAINSLLSTTTGFAAYNPTRVIASDIRFETGSSPSERMRIDSSGNVGIGTSSPGATLTVVTNTTSHNGMRVTNNSTTQFAGSGLQMLGPSAAGSQGGAGIYYYNTNVGGTTGGLGIAQLNSSGNFQRNLAYYDFNAQSWAFLTNSTERLTINSSGNVTANVDFRAPIFYDSNNTAFYVDPASGSRLGGQVTFNGGTNIASNGDVYARRDSGSTGVYYFADGGSKFLYWDGSQYNFGGAFSTVGHVFQAGQDMRAPIFYDSNNTAFYLDPASTSVTNVLRANAIQFSNGNTAITLDNSSYNILRDPTGSIRLYLGGADPANYYDNDSHFFRNRATAVVATINSSGVSAPSFIDSNDTAFFVDPNGTSVVARLGIRQEFEYLGSMNADYNSGYYHFSDTQNTPNGAFGHAHIIRLNANWNVQQFWGTGTAWDFWFRKRLNGSYAAWQFVMTSTLDSWNTTSEGQARFYFTPSGRTFLRSGNGFEFRSNTDAYVGDISNGGNWTASADMRAPIFYDSNNTGFYLDPSNLTYVNTLITAGNITARGDLIVGEAGVDNASYIYMQDADEGQRVIHCNSNRIGFLTQGGGWGSWCNDNGDWQTDASVWAPIFYDINNSFFYLNLNGYSQINGFGSVNASSGVGLNIMGDLSNGAMMAFHRSAAFAINMGLDTDNVFRMGGWSAAANRLQMDMSGNLTMAGNVTAYSDIRLKKDIETIDGALELVSKMRGVRYTRIDTENRNVGVIAQEMLEVLPEVVQQGVGDDDTLSVAYGNLVGVLIEAVKELTARVAELEGK